MTSPTNVTSVPASCPKCHCTDRTKTESVTIRDMSGTTRDGFKYTQICWAYCNCKQCGNRYRIIEYRRPSRTCEKPPEEKKAKPVIPKTKGKAKK